MSASTLERGRRWVVWAVVAYFISTWLAIALVDIADLADSRSMLEAANLRPPALWMMLYAEGRTIEWAQWTLCVAFTVLSARLAAELNTEEWRAASTFWSIMTVLGALLVLEDAGNVRHSLASYVTMVWDAPYARTLTELLFYMLLGAIALYGLVIYSAVPRRSHLAWRLFITGTILYGVAGAASATRRVADWYHHSGEWILDRILQGRLPALDYGPDGHRLDYGIDDITGYAFMDVFVEESIELVAITLLVLAVLSYFIEFRHDQDVARAGPGLWSRGSLLARR
jgi:hypothetical protein